MDSLACRFMERAGCLGYGTVPGSKAQQYKEVEFNLFPPLTHLRGWACSPTDLQGERNEGSNVSATDKATALCDTAMSWPAAAQGKQRAAVRAAVRSSSRSGLASTSSRLQAK